MALLDPTDTTEDIWDFVGSGVSSQMPHGGDWCDIQSVSSREFQLADADAVGTEYAILTDFIAMEVERERRADDEFVFMETTPMQMAAHHFLRLESIEAESPSYAGSSTVCEDPLTPNTFTIEFEPLF